ncbi:hypothetical protein KI659_16035 [Litoribacter alkaliphilus]|uniref:HNH Cas9-type domain-containing protein n=1 Tax=Litoribacter ruber TaxID=702568 RepID=A0AAP2CJW4_9BACT|nr:type II CRISPR RNA-guided endonuclease Cas9 [Litoribacter alkaliphilus]MBS9525527.1 hypothetical protein [Litoribacter alkaliphilus]
MEKIFGIDLGTNSFGGVLREGGEFPWYGVCTFKKGVGNKEGKEYSYAGERTKNRATRRLYNARRYRKWATLQFLISNNYCPLAQEKLNEWRYYSKDTGRTFPVDDDSFNSWIKLDFNKDGFPDYSSPYQLRRELLFTKLNLNERSDRYKLGRALYHIAQRRGFKSSRKNGGTEKVAIYKGSSKTATIGRNEYEQLILDHKTLGAAFAFLEDSGIRIRNRYTLRADYEQEVDIICSFQELEREKFLDPIKKAIFYQRPLRSQKGLVGKCTLEPKKPRSPVSHPAFEEFRAWSFLNNIKYFESHTGKWEPIPLALKEEVLKEKFFFKNDKEFEFSRLNKHLQKIGNKKWKFNFKDETSVPGCPVSARLRSLFGEDWMTFEKTKQTFKYGKPKTITYTIEDVWHVLFSYEDEEIMQDFFLTNFEFNEEQLIEVTALWNSFPDGYASLSLKAINNILPFLRKGLTYTEAVLMAKIPDLMGVEAFAQNQDFVTTRIIQEIEDNRKEKKAIGIVNKLIADYFLEEYKQGFNDPSYKLDADDRSDIQKAISAHFGEEAWDKEINQQFYISRVESLYQDFFASRVRKHFLQPNLLDQVKKVLEDEFHLEEKMLSKLYHPSQIDIYSPAKMSDDGKIYLPSPKTGAFKNPMAYKALYQLRRVMNNLIATGKIDEDTRIVVEIARELNDANKRWAIEAYQRQRENENREIAFAITQLLRDPEFRGNANPDNQTDKEKLRLWTEQSDNPEEFWKEVLATKDDVKKYRLWKEQGCICFYTGKVIRFTQLFDPNIIQFEHTIPRSQSFDNSLANQTVCYTHYNHDVKKNRLPVELPNYEEDTNEGKAIKPHLINWEKKIDSLYKLIQKAKASSKYAQDKSQKDAAIRKRHLLQMEYNYWKNKIDRFTRKDVPSGFKNSQLIDSQLISKYAFHYLKTVFNRVDVQKGTVTSIFRKIYGIQSKEEEKDRSKHYHHAIDAAVLTLIPKAAERERILKEYFEDMEECRKQKYPLQPFDGFSNKVFEEIKENILINNIPNKDQAFSPGKKVVRRRGKVVFLRDSGGKLILDCNGNKVPKIAQGDSIRGQLHEDKFYGKVKVVKRDPEGKPLRDVKNNYIFEEKEDGFRFVIRRPIEEITDLKKIVDPHLARMIEAQINGRSLSKAINDGVWMINKLGEKVNKIRRVRCWTGEKPLAIKSQTYKSRHDYKNYYYASNGENFAFAMYLGEDGKRYMFSKSLYEVRNLQNDNSFELRIEIPKGKSLIPAFLFHVFKVGQKVLFYEKHPDEIEISNKIDISRRLYYVERLYDSTRGNIRFRHHLEARSDDQLLIDFPEKEFGKKGKNGFSKFSSEQIWPRLLLSHGNMNFLIEGKDFSFGIGREIVLI